MGEYSFNADDAPKSSFALLPPGWYAAVIEDAVFGQTQKGANSTTIKFRINENRHPDVGGRVITLPLFWDGVSEAALRISLEHLGAICHAVGQKGLEDRRTPNELLARRIAIRLKIEPAKVRNGVSYDERNQFCGFDSIESIAVRLGGQAPPAQSAAAQGSAQPAGAAPSRSWRKS